jgi:hypothetical protein
MAGPDMKSPSSSPTKTPSLEGPLTGYNRTSLPFDRCKYPSSSALHPRNSPEDQFAANDPSLRPPQCCTMVVLVFRYQEIGTKMALTEFPTPGTRKV